jgi:hypothetical protein
MGTGEAYGKTAGAETQFRSTGSGGLAVLRDGVWQHVPSRARDEINRLTVEMLKWKSYADLETKAGMMYLAQLDDARAHIAALEARG